jgi:hypothetical protein
VRKIPFAPIGEVGRYSRPDDRKRLIELQTSRRKEIAQQICDGEIQRGEGCVLWDDPLTPATKKISRRISRNEKTLAAWCRGKYLIPLVIAYAAHGAHETVQ